MVHETWGSLHGSMHRIVRRSLWLFPLLLGCGPAPSTRIAPFKGAILRPEAAPSPARWLPVTGAGGSEVEVLADGTRRSVVRRLRVEEGPGGTISIARDLLPDGTSSQTVTLPARLGGGTLFLTAVGGTVVHLASEFLGPLRPIARFRTMPLQVSVAPDRVLLRAADGSRVHSIELPAGTVSPPVGLPIAPRVGQIFFADAFRGVADIDLVGLVATEDAGSSWHPLGVSGPFLEMSSSPEGIVVSTASSRYTIDTTGSLSAGEALSVIQPAVGARAGGNPGASSRKRSPSGPLGPAPASMTVERGLPVAGGTALVAADGKVLRVRLTDFAVVDRSKEPTSLDRDDSCRAVPYGAGAAFVCGGEGSGTSLHLVDALLDTREILRFTDARSVRSNGRGSLAISGSCRGEPPGSGSADHCILDGVRPARTVRTRGDVGRERVVPFSDGRVLVLEPPRDGDDGQATVVRLDGTKTTVALLSDPAGEDPPNRKGGPKTIRDAFWTHDFTEVTLTEVAGWIELGGAVRGVRVHVDTGEVTVGTAHPTALTGISGPYGLTLNEGGRGAETTDGGATWAPFDQPEILKTRPAPGRFCTAVGCVLPFEPTPWVRVGWGEGSERDLEEARTPAQADDVEITRSFSLQCDLVAVSGPPPEPARKPKPADERAGLGAATPPAGRQGDWESFRGFLAPELPKGFSRYDNGSPPSLVHSQLYAWTPTGATTRDPSRWLARFYDRFDAEPGASGGVRSTAAGGTPYVSEEALAELLGYRNATSNVQTLLDAGGHAALIGIGRSTGEWDLVSAVEGRAPALLAPPPGGWPPLVPALMAAAWLDGAWVIAHQHGFTEIYVATTTETRDLIRLPRVGTGSNEPVRVVRRAQGRAVGVLVGGMGPGGIGRAHHVLPIDLDTGKAGEIIRLGSVTMGDKPLRRCEPGEDGWIVDLGVGGGATLRLPLGARVTDPEVRARLDPGKVCLDGISARLQALPSSATSTASAAAPKSPVPARVGSGRRLPKPPAARAASSLPAGLAGVMQLRGRRAPASPGTSTTSTEAAQPPDASRVIPLVATDGTGRRLVARCGPR